MLTRHAISLSSPPSARFGVGPPLAQTLPPAAPPMPPPPPRSCDTFVALPPATPDGSVVFGKNSDREREEVQEVVAYAGGQHPAGSMVNCTYVTIPQTPSTYSVVLSKPTWMWGAEMGANEAGVVCGNEAVWTVEASDAPPALLGMDLVRLGLERGRTAEEVVAVITSLLEEHGQGGACEEGGDWTYHNSFLIADAREAWVLETAGRCWAAQRITQGVRNISNCLSIRAVFDRCSVGLQEYARQKGYWDGAGQFDFAAAFSDGGAPPIGQLTPGREENGFRLLQAAVGQVTPAAMMRILRDRGSGICMCDGGFRSNGSQVSRLQRVTPSQESNSDLDGNFVGAGGTGVVAAAQHWFTATPDPQRSVYKPFAFPSNHSSCNKGDGGSGGDGGSKLERRPPEASPYTGAQPAPRNPPHALWRAWQAVHDSRGGSSGKLKPAAVLALNELEARGRDLQHCGQGLTFAAAVEEELRLYGAKV